MANLLLDASAWNEVNYNSGTFPPPEWDGTKYLFVGSNMTGKFGVGANMTASVDDSTTIVAFNATNHSADTTLLQVISDIDGTLYSHSLTSGQTVTYTSPTLTEGSMVSVWVGQGQGLYSQDMEIDPLGDTIFAPDETITCNQGSPPLSVTPVITDNGSPTTPDSLTILSQPANGTASVSDVSLVYQPNSGFNGNDSFTYLATVGATNSNTATVHCIVQPVEPCDELGRTTKAYVSGYNLARRNVARVRRMAKRCVVAQFNGALTKGRKIVSVRWETTSPWALYMSNARIASNQRETMVDVIFNFSGWGGILATATMDNGEVYNQEFEFTVLDAPLYPTADYPTSNGPYRLDATI